MIKNKSRKKILLQVTSVYEKHKSLFRGFITVLFFAYLLFIVWITLLNGRTQTEEREYSLELFWVYKAYFRGEFSDAYPVIQNIGNVVFFVPFGLLFPVFERNRKRNGLIVLSGFLVSLLMELLQYFLRLGLCELDDLICNTLGAAVGVFLFTFLTKFFSKR